MQTGFTRLLLLYKAWLDEYPAARCSSSQERTLGGETMFLRLLWAIIRLRRIPANGVYVLGGKLTQEDLNRLGELSRQLPDVLFLNLTTGARVTRVDMEEAIRQLRRFDRRLRKREQRISKEAR